MKTTRALLLLLAVSAASCSDSPNEPTTVGVSGSLSFSYTGAGAASATTYSATGAIPANFGVTNGSQAWAAGSVDAANNTTTVLAYVPKGSNTWDWTGIEINRTTVGSSSINVNCSSNCTDVVVWFGMNQNGTNFTYICSLTTGTVTISSISSTKVVGTFSGSGTCSAAGSTTPSNFTVTNGSFDVGLTTLVD